MQEPDDVSYGAYLAALERLPPSERRARTWARIVDEGPQFRVTIGSKPGDRILLPEVRILRTTANDRFLRHDELQTQLAALSQPLTPPTEAAPSGAGGVLRFAVRLLPPGERAEWMEEQRGYLADLPTRRARWAWIVEQLAAMPRYAYTVRTGRQKESA